jgi:integrase
VAPHPLYAAWLLAATTGMRRGELLGHATIAITMDTYSHVLPAWTSEPPRPWRG